MDLKADYVLAPIASKIFLIREGVDQYCNTLYNICRAVEDRAIVHPLRISRVENCASRKTHQLVEDVGDRQKLTGSFVGSRPFLNGTTSSPGIITCTGRQVVVLQMGH